MGTFVLEDLGAAIEVMVFPKTMLQYGELLDADAIVVIKARVDGRDDTPKLMAMEITRPEINLDGAQPLTLRVKAARAHRRAGRDGSASSCARTPATARCSSTSSAPRRRPSSASATSSAATPATASTPSSASSSAPTASPEVGLRSAGSVRTLASPAMSASATTQVRRAGPHGRVSYAPRCESESWGRRVRREAGWRRGSRTPGHEVLYGSRAVDKAKQSVAELNTKWGDRVANLHPCDNAWACDAPVVILAVNADSAIPTVHEHAERLAGQDRRVDGEQPREARQRVQRGAPAARIGRRGDPGAACGARTCAPRSISCPRPSSPTSTTRWRAT